MNTRTKKGLKIFGALVFGIWILSAIEPVTSETIAKEQTKQQSNVKEQAKQEQPVKEQSKVKAGILKTCKKIVGDYGEALILSCVEQNLEAKEELDAYDAKYKPIIKRCTKIVGAYGYDLIQSCVDTDIEAEEELDKI